MLDGHVLVQGAAVVRMRSSPGFSHFLVALVPLWHLVPREALLRAAASMDVGLCRRVTGCSMQWVGRETHAHLQREDS